jgi:hypothetical protein
MLEVDDYRHAADIRLGQETLEAAGENRLPGDGAELLGGAVPGAGPAARRHDHDRDVWGLLHECDAVDRPVNSLAIPST